MRKHILQQLSMSAMALTLVFFGAIPAFGASDAEDIVAKAEATFGNFQSDPQMSWIREHLRDAKAVMIAPDIRKAAFVVGGSGGRAILLARDPNTGNWSGPAFYSITSASLGFQAGIETSETVMLVMTEKGLNSLLSSQFKLGADISIAAGPIGSGSEKGITTDVVTFSRTKGVYGGINLDGTVVKVSDEWNRHYYGRSVTPPDILVRHSAVNPRADRLLEQVAQAATK